MVNKLGSVVRGGAKGRGVYIIIFQWGGALPQFGLVASSVTLVTPIQTKFLY